MRARSAIVAALWLASSVFPSAQQGGDDGARLLRQARELEMKGQFREALPIAQRAVTAFESVGTASEADLASAAFTLGNLQFRAGNFAGASTAYGRSLAIREKGADVLATSEVLYSLANAQRALGQLAEAEELFARGVALVEKTFGPSHPALGTALVSYGSLVDARGDPPRAQAMLRRARTIFEQNNAAGNADYAALLNNLGLSYRRTGQLELAREALERSLALREKLFGAGPPVPPQVATGIGSLAGLYQEMGQFDLAEPLQRRALAAAEAATGASSVQVATVLTNLAMIRSLRQDPTEAEALFLRAAKIREATLGSRHVDLASTLEKLAVAYQISSRRADALAAMTRATDILEQNLQLMLSSGSEQQRLNYMSTIRENTDIALSMRQSILAADDTAATMAAALVLRRKGRVLDAMVSMTERLRNRLTAEDAKLLDQLADARTKLAALVLQPGAAQVKDRGAQTAALEADIERLESTLSARIRDAELDSKPVETHAVQQHVPADTRLVEFVRYRPFDPQVIGQANRFGKPRYAAFVLSRTGAPQWVELSDAETIDRLIAALRAALRSPLRSDAKDRSRDLAKLILDPLANRLDGAKRVIVSPDGELSLIPFAALLDQRGRYLIEQFEIASLASGRDLLRVGTHVASRDAPLIVADPAFSTAAAKAIGATASFQALPGTAQEAQALRLLLPDAKVATRSAATEGLIKGVKGPRLLHIATHGFFFDALAAGTAAGAEQRGLTITAAPVVDPNSRFALLRSGLALAGANDGRAGNEDGLLTALEAASLDLRGTELVVLSACETGLGEVRSGDGVHGLRRALSLAGAETQVMSLWQVQDEATRDLMIGFYRKLIAKTGRASALRAVQLDWLRKGKRTHPFYWAAFVVSGDWSPLSGN